MRENYQKSKEHERASQGKSKNKQARKILIDIRIYPKNYLLVRPTYRLKGYDITAFLMREFSLGNTEQQDQFLRLRRHIIDKGCRPEIFCIRNLTLQHKDQK